MTSPRPSSRLRDLSTRRDSLTDLLCARKHDS